MSAAGDRVIFEGTKVGGGRREGELVELSGRSVRVRWSDGTESLVFPGPGAMRIEPAPKSRRAAARPSAPAKSSAKASKQAAKKAATKAKKR